VAHTAVKIAPHYSGPVVHVLDASRAVGVVSSLLSPEQRDAFIQKNKDTHEKAREAHRNKRSGKPLLPLATARGRRTPLDWSAYTPPKPEFIGSRVIDPAPLEEIAQVIDWSPFFHTWDLRGRYPAILQDPVVGEEATKLFNDAQKLLQRIITEKRLTVRGVYGFFPANSVCDDVEVYTDESRTKVLTTFHFLRQQMDKPKDQFNHSLSDYIAPKSSGKADYFAGFAVTSGLGLDEFCAEFEKDHDSYSSILAKALADRLAEASAEWLHKKVRDEWGFGRAENLTLDELIHEKYQGIRPAAGYPACPDHTEKTILFDLLDAEKKTGIYLTESMAMHPGSSVSGLYFSHPEAKYFGVGQIDRDQIADYSIRKNMTVPVLEKWLSPNLNYDPEAAPIPAAPLPVREPVRCGCGLIHP
jgi:5-methyltetrahydrofolate--homocysteine methyltransferase